MCPVCAVSCSSLALLKVDIEHAEKIAIPAMLARLRSSTGGKGLPFKQLLMEIHHSDKNKSATVNLMEVGLRVCVYVL